MNISFRKSQIRTLKHGDKNFYIEDKFVMSPRAGFEIKQECPKEYKLIIVECIRNGWLTPVANVTEREMLFMGLTDDTV